MAAISILFYSLLLISFSKATTTNNGFTTSLIHRDSLLNSPLHNDPSLSHYHRRAAAFRRSVSRSSALLLNRASIAYGSGEYLMSVFIGTPPVPYVAIADTGSDLTWTQCLPCQQCYHQSHPFFNPDKSSSFRHVPCTSPSCHALGVAHCGPHGSCDYKYTYGDQTYSQGDLGFDKITIGSSSVNTVIGCGHVSGGGFGLASGVIGLGGGKLSLISQMSQTAAVTRRYFSYCLPTVLSHAIGKINFGENAVVSGAGVVSTPLVVPKIPSTYYSMTLEAVSVGGERHAADVSSARGNMIIDTGTTLTILPKELYDGVVSSLVKVVRARRVEDPGGFFGLCFAAGGGGLDVPVITAHFAGGADVRLLAVNTFEKVADGVSCLTLTPASPRDPFGILGNLAQANFLIGYDLELNRLLFKPTVCA